MLSSVSTTLKYVIGYESAKGAVMKLVYRHDLECPGGNSTVLWSSKPLTGPSFDKCKTCYANATVAVSNLTIDTATPGALTIQFENNGHNVQLDLPLDFKLGWK